MPKQIALVSCVSKKRSEPCPASQLYVSDWFLKAVAFAQKHSDEWYILSAKYGLLNPHQIIEPYNLTLKTMSKFQREAWARYVFSDLRTLLSPNDTVIFLAGHAYREYLERPIAQIGCRIEIPMEGLKIGEQLQWLNQH